MPALKVEEQEKERVGKKVVNETYPIEAAITLRYPADRAQVDDIEKALEACRLSYCALYPNKGPFPTTGWLKGSVSDLADLIHLVDVPESAFDKCPTTCAKALMAPSPSSNTPEIF